MRMTAHGLSIPCGLRHRNRIENQRRIVASDEKHEAEEEGRNSSGGGNRPASGLTLWGLLLLLRGDRAATRHRPAVVCDCHRRLPPQLQT